MIEIRQILCPTDFSEISRRAFDHAVAIARYYDARVRLLHVGSVVPVLTPGPAASGAAEAQAGADDRGTTLARLERFAQSEAGGAVPVECEIADGDPAREILARAAALPADLVVLGTHGRSGFARLVLGSTTERVLRQASCPVLSVPPRAPDAVPAAPVLFKRLLCALDFSDHSLNALEYALSLTGEADAHLIVLHVFEPPADVDDGAADAFPGVREYIAAALEERRRRLEAIVPANVQDYCTVETRLVTGRPHREIVRAADEEDVDAILMGVHGRSAADLWFFGSTAQQVVRHATCPVLTLRKG